MSYTNVILRFLKASIILLGLAFAASISAQPPDDPALGTFPQPGFATDERALIIQVQAVDETTYEFLGAALSLSPPGITFGSPPQLGVIGLDGKGRALVVRNAPYPRWVFDQDDGGNEFKTELDGEIAYITLTFDRDIREIRIEDLQAEVTIASIDMEPSLVQFCRNEDITDQEYCSQFPCFNDPSQPECIDTSDSCPSDPLKTSPGACGCGIADTDSDLDGTPDCVDFCPADGFKIDPGACGCGTPDNDLDGDGIADCIDQCPADAGKDLPGVCGCGVADDDTDDDAIANCNDNCPALANPGQSDSDADGLGDICDPTPDGEPVAGDINADGTVDGQDYTAIRAALGSCAGDANYRSAADFTNDQCVAYDDYQYWYATYFSTTNTLPPSAPGC